jgi:hypothetical protein
MEIYGAKLMENNENKENKKYNETKDSTCKGILSTLVFMAVAIVVMIIISKYMH